jgi:L-cystine uptake protein TcyP (sodium:dicarboxylate symporter family)
VRASLVPETHNVSLKAPWVEWRVDNEYLKRLNEWNALQPQSTAISVMKKVQEKLSRFGDIAESEVVKEVMELIPNDPFPAGTLVKVLLNVLVIGIVSFHVVWSFELLRVSSENTGSETAGI